MSPAGLGMFPAMPSRSLSDLGAGPSKADAVINLQNGQPQLHLEQISTHGRAEPCCQNGGVSQSGRIPAS